MRASRALRRTRYLRRIGVPPYAPPRGHGPASDHWVAAGTLMAIIVAIASVVL